MVQIELDNGLTGIGSAYSHPDLVRIIVERHLAPFLVGGDPTDVERIWDLMYGLTRWYGRKGVAISALGAVDIALWDLRGKITDRPLYELLGAQGNSVEAYASALLWQDDPFLLADEAARHRANGFTTMKMRLGHDPEYDRAAVLAVQQAAGDGCRIAVDGTHRYALDDARAFARFLAERDIRWFEEPFPPEALDDYVALRETTDVPIAAGENEFGVQGFRELLRAGCVDIIQPDASRAGGVTELLRIAGLAAEHGAELITHTWSDAVALMANAHAVAAAETGAMIEVDRTGNPFIDELTRTPLEFQSGRLVLPDAPGLGIELDWESVGRYAVAADEYMSDGNYADLVFGSDFHPVAADPEIRSAQ